MGVKPTGEKTGIGIHNVSVLMMYNTSGETTELLQLAVRVYWFTASPGAEHGQ